MFIGLSYDGRIYSTDAEHIRDLGNGIHLAPYNLLSLEIPGCATFVSYYGPTITSEACIRGKIRFIGNALVTYYDSDYELCIQGKVRYLGPYLITYYDSSYESCIQGKVRTIGGVLVTYFDSDSPRAGKVKNIGDVYLG